MNAETRVTPAEGAAAIPVRRVAVVGAGLMGGGIAAQFANAGIPVDLLDVRGSDPARPSAAAMAGIERQLKVGGFMHPSAAALVRPGNIDDDLGRLAGADWIVEAIVEDLDAKRDLYAKVAAVRRPGAIVSSNTSTFRREDLLAGAAPDFASGFVVTHFFNPPRAMQLVEVVAGTGADPAVVALARAACATILGKTVVDGRDTPGFIANRIGCYWMAVAAIEAIRHGLTVEEADAVMRVFGTPRTGIFGLLDLIGIDLVPKVWPSLMANLPAEDAINRHDLPAEPVVVGLLAAGRTGRKAGAGFYRLVGKQREALDLATGAYRPEAPVDPSALPSGRDALATLVGGEGRLADYAREVLYRTVQYAAACGPEVAETADAVDAAMTLGYAWSEGPLRLGDRVGLARIAEGLAARGETPAPWLVAAAAKGGFYDAEGRGLATDGSSYGESALAAPSLIDRARRGNARIAGNAAASLFDTGDGIGLFQIHTKMNALAPEVFDLLEATLDRPLRGLVLGSGDPRAFSAGADLGHFTDRIRAGDWTGLEAYVARGQDLFLRLAAAPFPSVAAAHGVALGGGAELMLHASVVVAHAELVAGFPESTLGIVPAWGGTARMLARKAADPTVPKGPVAVASATFDLLFGGGNSGSALDARARGLLGPGDRIVMNRGEVLDRARAKALAMAEAGYAPPPPLQVAVAGPSGCAALVAGVLGARRAGRLTDTDVRVGEALAEVVTGGAAADPLKPVGEAEIMRLEREAIMRLSRLPESLARIDHLRATGKPLRN